MQPRDEETALSGLLSIRMGGQVKEVPTLKIAKSRKWKTEAAGVVEKVLARIPDDAQGAQDALAPMVNLPTDVALDLVLAYDVTNALGTRKWVEDNADDREVLEALQQMLTATFPFGSVLRSVVGASGDELREMAMAYLRTLIEKRRLQGNSTNGHSDTGALTLMASQSDSATSNT